MWIFSDIDKFEKNNNIAINVFGYNEEESKFGNDKIKCEIFPLRVSKANVEQINTHVNTHVVTWQLSPAENILEHSNFL